MVIFCELPSDVISIFNTCISSLDLLIVTSLSTFYFAVYTVIQRTLPHQFAMFPLWIIQWYQYCTPSCTYSITHGFAWHKDYAHRKILTIQSWVYCPIDAPFVKGEILLQGSSSFLIIPSLLIIYENNAVINIFILYFHRLYLEHCFVAKNMNHVLHKY